MCAHRREGRFHASTGRPSPTPGHSSVLQALGVFILWVGWNGFNAGSTLAIRGPRAAVAARVVVTSTLSAAGGGVATVALDRRFGSRGWEVMSVCNGILAGLVSITAGCATVATWAALLTGGIGGLVYLGAAHLVLHVAKIDDPLNAFAVHGACGTWGLLAAALFSAPSLASEAFPAASARVDHAGAIHGGGAKLGAACVFAACVAAWSAAISSAAFLALRGLKLLRAPYEPTSVHDLFDTSRHGGELYRPAEGAPASAADKPSGAPVAAEAVKLRPGLSMD